MVKIFMDLYPFILDGKIMEFYLLFWDGKIFMELYPYFWDGKIFTELYTMLS